MAIQFGPDIVENPEPLDVDLFIEFLGFTFWTTVNPRLIASVIWGCYGFQEDEISNFQHEHLQAELSRVPANTIIIDEGVYQQMETDGHEGRYRFTEAHECGHVIMHDFYARQAKSIQAAQHSLAAYHSGECQSALPALSDSDLAEVVTTLLPVCSCRAVRFSTFWRDWLIHVLGRYRHHPAC